MNSHGFFSPCPCFLSSLAVKLGMGSMGVYANYSGALANGVQLGGRIHCACIDKVLYCIEIVYPLEYKKDFEAVFSEMRTSIKRN